MCVCVCVFAYVEMVCMCLHMYTCAHVYTICIYVQTDLVCVYVNPRNPGDRRSWLSSKRRGAHLKGLKKAVGSRGFVGPRTISGQPAQPYSCQVAVRRALDDCNTSPGRLANSSLSRRRTQLQAVRVAELSVESQFLLGRQRY